MHIQPASWVPQDEAECAKAIYALLAERFLKNKRQKNESSFDEFRFLAIESLVTDACFKKFWRKASNRKVSGVTTELNGIFTTYQAAV